MKAVVAAFNQEKALVGAFSVITNLRMELFEPVISPGGGATLCWSLLLVDSVGRKKKLVEVSVFSVEDEGFLCLLLAAIIFSSSGIFLNMSSFSNSGMAMTATSFSELSAAEMKDRKDSVTSSRELRN